MTLTEDKCPLNVSVILVQQGSNFRTKYLAITLDVELARVGSLSVVPSFGEQLSLFERNIVTMVEDSKEIFL
jgi:hypothetical protein